MRIGLIARADSTGLGTQSKEFFNHIPCKALVIDFQNMAQESTKHILQPDLSAFTNQTVFKWGNRHPAIGGIPIEIIDDFIKDIDILFCMETPYDYNLFSRCRRKGVKTILQLNYEFLDFPSELPPPDLFAAPSLWNYDKIPGPKIHLPVPAKDSGLVPRAENTFLHIAGRHASRDRNGTQTLFEALKYIKNQITVIVHGQQDSLYVPPIGNRNVRIIIDTTNKKDYSDNYSGGILVMPRKYGGLCLPMNEAISFGMPVIATDISPNNTWLPAEWLVPGRLVDGFRCKKPVDVYEANPTELAEKMDMFCHPVVYSKACSIAEDIKKTITWEALLPKYMETFNSL